MRFLGAVIILGLIFFNASAQAESCSYYFQNTESVRLQEDPYRDYEDVSHPNALAWVDAKNLETLERLKSNPRYSRIYSKALQELNSQDRILSPNFYKKSRFVRDFWTDEQNPQGILRQTTQESYFSGTPQWETLFDVDALSYKENKRWVFEGNVYPRNSISRSMLALSDGGKDAVEWREYDFEKKEFVENGFYLPESKSGVSWLDENTLLVADATVEANVTRSEYPRVLKLWKRGEPFAHAKILYEALKEDLNISGFEVEISQNQHEVFVGVVKNFFEQEIYVVRDGKMILLPVPLDAQSKTLFQGQLFYELKSDWQTEGVLFKQGSIIVFDFNTFLTTGKGVRLFREPMENGSVSEIVATQDYVYVTTLEDVQTRMYQYRLEKGEWQKKQIPIADLGSASLVSFPEDAGYILYVYENFLTPTALYKMDEKTLVTTRLQSLPQRFDPSLYKVEQLFATSKDGTKVPYFIISEKDLILDGKNPTLQYGYGGFSISETPFYMATQELGWLQGGGVFVVANIRGGGEYGPAWHQAAIKENRHKAFEDFISISEDLIRRGITSPQHLAVEGASNGGLLTGAVITLRPDLYNAAIIAVPLLDMLNFHKFPPGSSWMPEYGDPSVPAERDYLATYSPYQNLKPEVSYPEVFLITSSADDRVHPSHARKFAKRLEEYRQSFFYYENKEGGHHGSANSEQTAQRFALERTYLWQKLGGSSKSRKK